MLLKKNKSNSYLKHLETNVLLLYYSTVDLLIKSGRPKAFTPAVTIKVQLSHFLRYKMETVLVATQNLSGAHMLMVSGSLIHHLFCLTLTES